MIPQLAPRDTKALRSRVLGALSRQRLYAWGEGFWEAVGGSAEYPSLLRICSFSECGFVPANQDAYGRVDRLGIFR